MPVVLIALVVAAVLPPVKSSSATNGAAAGPPAEMSIPPEPPLEPTVQVNVVDPLAPVVSVAVTVTDDVPAVLGVPLVCPDAESVAPICRLAAVPTVDAWLAGVVTVTMWALVPGDTVHTKLWVA